MTDKDMFKGTTYSSLEEQVGGKHYKNFRIQPAEFINENKLLFADSVKGKQQECYKIYLQALCKRKATRYRKSTHYLKMILERDYS